MHSKLF